MNKVIFLKELNRLLSDLSEDEKEEAMSYYEEYFMEAGDEKEDEVIRKLGSPQEVSYKIHEELSDKSLAVVGADSTAEKQKDGKSSAEKKPINGWKIACIVLACLFVGPIVIPVGLSLLAAAFALVVSAVVVVVALAIAWVAVVCALAIVSLALFMYGITRLITAPFAAILLMGLSLLSLVLFIVLGWGAVKMIVVVVPAVCKGIWNLVCLPFRKKKA